jgi:hypothetical protein
MSTWTGPDFLWYQRNALLTEGKGWPKCFALQRDPLSLSEELDLFNLPPQTQGKGCTTSNLLSSSCAVRPWLPRTILCTLFASDFLTYASLLRRYIYLSGNSYTSQKSARSTKPAARTGEPRENKVPLSWSSCWKFRLSPMIWCAVELCTWAWT